MAAKKPTKQVASALPITDAESNAAIVRGLIAGLPPEFAGATKHLREIERRCDVIWRRGKSDTSAGACAKIQDFIAWMDMFAAGFAAEQHTAEKSADLSLF